MKSSTSEAAGRRSGRNGQRRRRGGRGSRSQQSSTPDVNPSGRAPKRQSLWQKIVGFFSGKPAAKPQPVTQRTTVVNTTPRQPREDRPERADRPSRKAEAVEVSSPKLYVGNLSYDATESDLFELFKGVGTVRNAEVVSHKHTMKSKGFGFVTMQSVDEARRAVEVLHDKDFMGRKLFVSGSKSPVERSSDEESAPADPSTEEAA